MSRRSKASVKKKKKTQAKKNTNIKQTGNAFGGVGITKGRNGKGQRQAAESNVIRNGKKSGLPSSSKMKKWRKTSDQKNNVGWSNEVNFSEQSISRNKDNIHANDFVEEQATLQERLFHENIKKMSHSAKRVNATLFQNLKPAIFNLGPQSTEDMVDDTAKKVANGLSIDHEQSQMQQRQQDWKNNLSNALASQQSARWNFDLAANTPTVSSPLSKTAASNPFAALQDDTCDDISSTSNNLFQPLPPSFQLANHLTKHSEESDVDDDL